MLRQDRVLLLLQALKTPAWQVYHQIDGTVGVGIKRTKYGVFSTLLTAYEHF